MVFEVDIDGLPLLDHHCHGVSARDLDRPAFEALLTEARTPGPPGRSRCDSQVGFALRRWCAPVLDLPRHVSIEAYLARRRELGGKEVTLRFLRAARLSGLCLDTGYAPAGSLGAAELAAAAGAPVYEVVRLESVAEECATQSGVSAADFANLFRERLAERCAGAVAVKTIAGYRVGLALDGRRPGEREVAEAAGSWLAELEAGAPVRLADQILHRFLIWEGVDLGLPVQIHAGYGDADVDLRWVDPLLLTELLRAIAPTRVPVMLLHNYPYHRNAGYLAQVFDNVFIDIGLAAHNVGNRAGTVLAEVLELAPFRKVLHSSDAFGLPELYYLGAQLFRNALTRLVTEALVEDEWSTADAGLIVALLCGENARAAYPRVG